MPLHNRHRRGSNVAISSERLHTIVDYLKTRPGHENVRGVIRELYVVGLHVPDHQVNFEIPVPEVRGRIDAIFGSTIFEFKRDYSSRDLWSCGSGFL